MGGSGAILHRAVIVTGILLMIAMVVGFTYAVGSPVLFLGLLALFFVVVARGARGFLGTNSYGSATWADCRELVRSGMLGAPNGIVLCRPGYAEAPTWRQALSDLFSLPVALSALAVWQWKAALKQTQVQDTLIRAPRYVHQLIVSPTGGGKGVSFVTPNLLSIGHSVLCLDPKGENAAQTSAYREQVLGNRILCLDPFGIGTRPSAQFNPLAFLDPKSPGLVDDVRVLAEALVVRTGKETDQHFNDMAVQVLTAFIYFTVVFAKPEERNLNTVRMLLAGKTRFQATCKKMEKAGGLMQEWALELTSPGERELGSILTTVSRTLSVLASPLIARHVATSTFDWLDLQRRPTTVYLIIPADKMFSHRALVRLYLASFMLRIMQQKPQERSLVWMLLDEVAQLGPMKQLEDALVIGRGYGLRMCLIFQSIGQIQQVFPEEKAQVAMSNCDHQLYWSVRDFKTAEDLSKKLGTGTIAVESQQWGKSGSSSDTTSPQGGSTSSSYSWNSGGQVNETGRSLLMPDEILQLPERAVICFAKGCRPLLGERVIAYEDPEFRDKIHYQPRRLMALGGAMNRLRRVALAAVVIVLVVLGLLWWQDQQARNPSREDPGGWYDVPAGQGWLPAQHNNPQRRNP